MAPHSTGRGTQREGCGEGEECEEVGGFAFVADGKASAAGEPGDRAFDHPAVAAKLVAGLDAFAGDPHLNSAAANPLT